MSSLLELERFVDAMIEEFSTSLHRSADNRKSVNMAFWMQAYAFDVVGELAFGKAFGYLASGQDIRGQMANSRSWLRKRFALAMVPWLFPVFMSPIFALFSSSGRQEQENEKHRNSVTHRCPPKTYF